MLFNSLEFIYFFVFVTVIYFALPHKFRWLLLLIASCYFYMAFVPIYILILFGTIIIDYVAGIYIEKERQKGEKNKSKSFLILSIIGNVGVLAVFKYYNFFNDNVEWLLKLFGQTNPIPYLNMILPIGLSFHTFQAMSYTIEVYRGNQKAEKHFGLYALYVMFYPQLVAGPIERPQNVLPQFRVQHKINYENVTSGLKLMAWGLFKKMVIADRLALITDPIFNDPRFYPGISLILASVFFSFQIFCDFSGYSDIALGSARVMGFKLMSNFNRPYHSTSISEFWRRWHISLSSWFKDYLYIPLGGNKVTIPRWYFNLLFVFIVSGFWHGANWTFIIWGALHGIYLVFAIVFKPLATKISQWSKLNMFPKINYFVNTIITFGLVTVAWVFFRSDNLTNAICIIKGYKNNLLSDVWKLISKGEINFGISGVDVSQIWLGILFIGIMEIIHIMQARYNLGVLINSKPLVIRWMLYYSIIFVIWSFGIYENKQFIYFQF